MTTPTPEALEAACLAYEEAMWKDSGSSYRNKYMEAALTAALALRPAGDAGEVAVKALEWEPYPNPVFAGPDVAIAHVEFRCFYQVQRDPHAPGFMAYLTPQYGTLFWESKGHNDIEAAKAAAQADYDRRIRSALAAPVRSPDAGVKEAGRKLAKAVWGIDFVEPPQPPEQEAVRVTDEAVRAVKEIKTLVVAAFNNPRLAKSTLNSVAHKLEALATALASAKPEGWRLVPVEPTDAMLKEIGRAHV